MLIAMRTPLLKACQSTAACSLPPHLWQTCLQNCCIVTSTPVLSSLIAVACQHCSLQMVPGLASCML